MIRRTNNAPAPSRDAFNVVLEGACRYYGVLPETLAGPSRSQPIVNARWMVMLLAYDLTGAGRERIAAWINKDKATVLNGLRQLRKRMKTDNGLANDYETLREQLHPRLAAADPRPELARAAEVSADYAALMGPHLQRMRTVMAGIAPIVVDAVIASVEHACVGIVRELDGVARNLTTLNALVHDAALRDPLAVSVRILELEGRRGAADQVSQAPFPSKEKVNGKAHQGEAARVAGAADA